MKSIKLILAILFCGFFTAAIAQHTDTLELSRDAMVRNYGGQGDNMNYGIYPFISMHAGTNGGVPTRHRALIDFDLSNIPSSATINSAKLYLYSDQNSTTTFINGHRISSGSNDVVIQRITSAWSENAVIWNNQPGTTTTNEVNVSGTTSNYQNAVVEVTNLIQDLIDPNLPSHGLMLRLQNEAHYRTMVFASSENVDPNIHPRLIVSYSVSTNIEEAEAQAAIKVYPSPTSGIFNIDLGDQEVEEYTLFDMCGRALMNHQATLLNNNQVDISHLPNGLYLLRLRGVNYTLDKKILKQE